MKSSAIKTIQQNGEYGDYCAASSSTGYGVAFEPDDPIYFVTLPPYAKVFRITLGVLTLVETKFMVGFTSSIEVAPEFFIKPTLINALAPGPGRPLPEIVIWEGKPVLNDEEITLTCAPEEGAYGRINLSVEYVFCGPP